MAASAEPRPFAIIINDWSGFCMMLDQEEAEGASPGARIVRAQRQWQDLEPAPAPAFPELLVRGTGFNVLRHSPALERWLADWNIAYAVHHPRTSAGLAAAPRAQAA